MTDARIRRALRARLEALHRGARDTKIFDELGLCEGRARVDMAVVHHRLEGFEIKSDQDSLARLDDQQRLYSKVFDRMTVVAHGAHVPRVLERVPPWWGVMQALGIGAAIVAFVERRPAAQNPARDPLALAQLLWRDEAIAILERRGLDHGVRSRPRRHAWRRASEAIAIDELAAEVRDALKLRRWRF
ncbi:MAG: sce7726 family protein [Acidobacteria bacterium]|nr:sce7726 family protein [Acidobacteriota bacterium]